MNLKSTLITILITIFMLTINTKAQKPGWMDNSVKSLKDSFGKEITDKESLTRFQKGLEQVAGFWYEEDGNKDVFEQFVKSGFIKNEKERDEAFSRIERILEKIDGHMAETGRELRLQVDLDLGNILPVDELFAAYNPSAHITDDFFANKIAFIILLNFPASTLDEQLKYGENWSRKKWAEARLGQRFSMRLPANINLEISRAASEADQYISGYNIWMHHLVDKDGNRLFPAKLRLLSHWNLRDEIKANYGNKTNGIEKQRTIQKVMERIVTQTIPYVVIDNPAVDWNPYTNEVTKSSVKDFENEGKENKEISNSPEPDTRYKVLLNTYLASRMADPYSPNAPTLIDRKFNLDRQIPESRVKKILEDVVSSPLLLKVAALIEKRLGRKLEPFDIWYNGFLPRGKYSEEELNKIVTSKYPSAKAFEDDIPNILVKLGFPKDKADFLAKNIAVDPARGSGHAMGAAMKDVKARLRTRIGKGGMDYKGFNIAVHELGHNVEQTLSLNSIDHTLLQGVPNTAFTEAFAFVFQANDLMLLGLENDDKNAEALKVLNDFWATFEIAGVALLDIEVWRWMYAHPDATPAQLKEATLKMAVDLWNKYYAPVLNQKDVNLLAIYSHMIDAFLYLPDYPVGHLIAFQIEEQMKKAGNIGKEFERMAIQGNIAPDLWMKNATSNVVGAEAMLGAVEKALSTVVK
ncbi:MAG: hypothetical protein C4539_10615 [Ignavibacteriales bacterium]|nr:MAG: hypothetical protein C4539_10615 [Ignavibacteriales bacterium]